MEERTYTAGEVHQILDQVLRSMDLHTALVGNQAQENLENDISHNASSSDARISMTVSEAVGMIGISKPKMYELIHSGQIRSVKVGKKYLISRQSILNWIQGGIENGKEAC